jgi:hypothetical protein
MLKKRICFMQVNLVFVHVTSMYEDYGLSNLKFQQVYGCAILVYQKSL